MSGILEELLIRLDEQSIGRLRSSSYTINEVVVTLEDSDDYWKKRLSYLLDIELHNVVDTWKIMYSKMKRPYLVSAIMNGYEEIVRKLLESVNPADYDTVKSYNLITIAIVKGYESVAELLVKDSRSDPTIGTLNAIDEAVRKGYVEIVRLLLNDERVIIKGISLLNAARASRSKDMVKLLMTDGRVNYKYLAPSKLYKIIGPVSWTYLKYKGRNLHFFGDWQLMRQRKVARKEN